MADFNFVRDQNLGDEFDIGTIQSGEVRLRIGSGLQRAGDGTISVNLSTTTADVDQSFGVFAPVEVGQNVNDNGPVNFDAASTAETGWAHTAATNAFTYTGNPNHVVISVMVHQEDPGGVSRARAAPTLILSRGGTAIAESATGYIRDATGHGESSNTISFIDYSPGANPSYTITSTQESTEGDSVETVLGHFSAKAVEKVTVVTGVNLL